jgi:hypothetical protein
VTTQTGSSNDTFGSRRRKRGGPAAKRNLTDADPDSGAESGEIGGVVVGSKREVLPLQGEAGRASLVKNEVSRSLPMSACPSSRSAIERGAGDPPGTLSAAKTPSFTMPTRFATRRSLRWLRHPNRNVGVPPQEILVDVGGDSSI